MILGANTDSSIDVSDPISDQFYKEVWMTTAARNATVYQNASASIIHFIQQKKNHVLVEFMMSFMQYCTQLELL